MFRVSGVAFILALLLGTTAQALSIGNEVPLSTAVLEPAPFTRKGARVASNGRDFLVVWMDDRAGAFPVQIIAARVDFEGRVLDPAGIVIGPGNNRMPSVASDGRDYVVAYDCVPALMERTCLARLNAETGEVQPGAQLSQAGYPVIASNGSGYLVAYLTNGPHGFPGYVDAVRLDAGASVVGSPFRIASTGLRPSMASNGDSYYIVWSTYPILEGRLVSADGSVGPVQSVAPTQASWGPGQFAWSVASDGDGYLVVWQQNVGLSGPAYRTDLRASAISRVGTPSGQRTLIASPTWDPAVAWTGSHYVVTFTSTLSLSGAPGMPRNDEGDIRELRVSRSAELSAGPQPVAIRAGSEAFSAAATGGAATLVVWEHAQPSGGVEIEAGLLGGEPFIVSRSVAWQESIAGTAIGSRNVVAWEEIVGEEQRRKVYLQKLGDRGIAVDSAPLDEMKPALGGSMIAWLQQEKVSTKPATLLAKRLDANGMPRDERPIVIGTAARGSRIAVTALGATHLIAWETPGHTIVAARVSQDGALLDAQPIGISRNGDVTHDPRIATDGTNFLVAWHREVVWGGCLGGGPCSWPTALDSVLVTPAGIVAGATIEIAPIRALLQSLVWNGSEYVAFWKGDDVETYYGNRFHARRITRNNQVVEPSREVSSGMLPVAVTWTGRDYLFAGTLAPNALTIGRLDRDFALTERTTVTASFDAGWSAALFPNLVAYQRASSADRVSRVVARTLSDETRRRAVGRR